MTAPTVQSIPLTGSDHFALLLDHRMRRAHLPGNICRLALRLDATLEPEALKGALARTGLGPWLANVRLHRALPFRPGHWRAANGHAPTPMVRIHDGAADWPFEGDAPGATLSDLSTVGLRDRAPVAFDLLRHAEGMTLLMTWHHGIMDAKGAEHLLQMIGGEEGDASSAQAFADPAEQRPSPAGSKLQAIRRQSREMMEVMKGPIASLANGGSADRHPIVRHRVITFTEAETARIDERGAEAGVGVSRSFFHLAAAMRAASMVRERRRLPAAPCVVPVPLDLRRRGQLGPVFSNPLSFLFYRAEPHELDSPAMLVDAFKSQMLEQLRNESPEAFRTAMRFMRPVPLWVTTLVMNRPNRGQFASLFFADLGASLDGVETFIGARVRAMVHFPPVANPPGVGVLFHRYRGRQTAVISRIEACVSDGETDLLESSLRADLIGEAAT